MEPKGKDPKAPVAALSPSPLLKKKYIYIYIYFVSLRQVLVAALRIF